MSEAAFEALALAKAAFPAIRRSKTVSVTMRSGGKYTFSYAPLEAINEAINPHLHANKLTISQCLVRDQNRGYEVLSELSHPSTGVFKQSLFPVIQGENDKGPQAFGSAVTYAQRYGVKLLLSLSTEDDDDGNAAEGNEVTVVKDSSPAPKNDVKELADRFLKAYHVGIDEAIYEVHEHANAKGADTYSASWSLLGSKERSSIKQAIKRVRIQKGEIPAEEDR